MPANPFRAGAALAGLAASAWIASAAYAQNEPVAPDASGSIVLPTLSITAQSGGVFTPAPFDDPAKPIGQTISTIDQDRIANTPAFSIGDVRDSPGISVKQGNGPRDIGISIRGSNARNGFGIRNIQVYEDGFPVTQPDGLSRTDITDPHAYSSIDVFRGPSSAMFGNYATGGAINFHMRPGSDIGGVELGSDAGSFNYFNEYALFGDRQGPFEYSGIVSHVRGDGFQPSQQFNTTTGNILASYAPTPDDKIVVKIIDNYVGTALPIRLSLNQYNLNPFQQGCLTPTSRSGCASVSLFANGFSTPSVTQTASQAGLGRHDQRTILGTRWEHNFDADTLWRTQFVYDNKDINQPTGATSAVGDQPAFNAITDLTQRWHGPNGLEGTHFAQASFNTVHLASDTFNVVPGGNAALGKLTAATLGKQFNAAVRGREELNFGPQWTLTGGLGIEYTQLDANNTVYAYSAAGIPTTKLIPVLRNYVNVAPEAALLFRPDDAWQLRGRVATGYGTPQASNLFVTSAGVPGNNTKLQPQDNVGLDIGADWTPSATLKTSLTGFYEIFHNELVTQSPGAGLQSFTFNAPRSEHRGIEAAADWRPLPGWRFTLAYLRNDQFYRRYTEQLSAGSGAAGKTASFDRSGNRIPGIEPDNLLVRLAYDQPSGPLTGLGGFVEGYWRDSFFIDNANLVRAPGYAVVNLNLHYQPDIAFSYAKKVVFFFEVQNLFNKTYVASANNVSDSLNATTGLPNGASTIASATGSIYAGTSRTLIGGVKVSF